ncbi:MAG: class I SAM-dependent methyltransferase [Chloroflexi bacterium]|nr:class I SAM-dependent methyltransferase [Chloroflexota bacterium]
MSVYDPKAVVRDGYDAVSYRYRGDQEDDTCRVYIEWLAELESRIPDGSSVLDLGCGCGVPVSQRLAMRHRVTGVDISPVQIERARGNVPSAEFQCADMTQVDFEAESFHAIVAFYSIIHVPVEEQFALLEKVESWLKPDGCLMATLGMRDETVEMEDWLGGGAKMYWSEADETTYLQWLARLGLEVVFKRFVPEGDTGHTLVLARK